MKMSNSVVANTHVQGKVGGKGYGMKERGIVQRM